MAHKPRIHDKFPCGEHLSPPIVAKPIPQCAEAVHVSGFVPSATITIFANTNEKLAEETPPFGFANVLLSRPVKLGDSITAIQEVNGIKSPHSTPVVVTGIPEGAVKNTKPVVGKDLYECGIVVPVDHLVPGVRALVTEDGQQIANQPIAESWTPILTKPLTANGKVKARQIACEGTPVQIEGPESDAVVVHPAPVPTPAPQPDAGSIIPGNDTLVLTGSAGRSGRSNLR